VVLERLSEAVLAPGIVVEGDVVDADGLAQIVRSLVKTSKPGAKDVRLGVASQRMVARQVDLPWVSPKEFKQALPLLAADMLPMPVQDCVLDFLSYEDVVDDDGAHLIRGLLVAANEQAVLEAVEAVESAGLRVGSVTLTPLSTLSALGDSMAVAPEALVDVGHTMTSISIHEHGQPRFMRILSRGGQDITQRLAEHLEIDADDAERWKRALPSMWPAMNAADQAATETAMRTALADLVSDIRTSIDFYTTNEGQRPGRAYVVGGGGATLGLVPILASVLRFPVVVGMPQVSRHGKALTPEAIALAASPASASAVGLALGAA
jgi:type IV pilus assembly protein PilM